MIGVVLALTLLSSYCVYRAILKNIRHRRVYASTQRSTRGDDDYDAQVVGGANSLENSLRRLMQGNNDAQLELEDLMDGADDGDDEPGVNQAFPLAHIENNPDGSVRDTSVVMAHWANAPAEGLSAANRSARVAEAVRGSDADGVVFVPDSDVVMIDTSPV